MPHNNQKFLGQKQRAVGQPNSKKILFPFFNWKTKKKKIYSTKRRRFGEVENKKNHRSARGTRAMGLAPFCPLVLLFLSLPFFGLWDLHCIWSFRACTVVSQKFGSLEEKEDAMSAVEPIFWLTTLLLYNGRLKTLAQVKTLAH